MSEFTTIAFMAESGHGKDFCGYWVMANLGFVRVAFGDPLKRLCKSIFQFSKMSLWGDPELRNTRVYIDWKDAQYRMVWNLDDWLFKLTNLSIKEKAEYKRVVEQWFTDLAKRANEFDGEMSPRLALQLLGTEYGRSFRKDIWISYLLGEVIPSIKEGQDYTQLMGLIDQSPSPPYNGAIITDCRFLNELEGVQKYNGSVVKIVRNSKIGMDNAALRAGVSNHESEIEIAEIADEKYNLVLKLDEGEDSVYSRLKQMFDNREFVNSMRPGLDINE